MPMPCWTTGIQATVPGTINGRMKSVEKRVEGTRRAQGDRALEVGVRVRVQERRRVREPNERPKPDTRCEQKDEEPISPCRRSRCDGDPPSVVPSPRSARLSVAHALAVKTRLGALPGDRL